MASEGLTRQQVSIERLVASIDDQIAALKFELEAKRIRVRDERARAETAALTACSQERTLDTVSGLVVAGPVGLVAGAVVGATTGPAIASSWEVHGDHHGRRRHRHHRSYCVGIFVSRVALG
jgi:hypothetical protein